MRGESFANQQLIVSDAVEVPGIKQCDARLERRVDRRDALDSIGRSVELGHTHATESEGGRPGTGRSKPALRHLHADTFSHCQLVHIKRVDRARQRSVRPEPNVICLPSGRAAW
jgi:hypothetical protein